MPKSHNKNQAIERHNLVIKSLYDAQLECTCGQWRYSYTGELSRYEAYAKHTEHAEQYSTIHA